MYVLWLLAATATIVVLVIPEWQVLRFARRAFRAAADGIGRPSVPLRSSPNDSAGQGNRPIRWISTSELRAILVQDTDDLLVIDLREQVTQPLQLPPARVLRIGPEDLQEILEWLPPTQSAAFCGVSGLAAFMIETSPGLCGTAPFYLLQEDRAGVEAA